jgi:hypothetical protein
MDYLKQNEQDGLADQERRDIYPELSNHHSARAHPLYQVIKVLDGDGGWNGLYAIQSRGLVDDTSRDSPSQDKKAKPLPKELDQSFTDVPTAIKAINNYIQSKGKKQNV